MTNSPLQSQWLSFVSHIQSVVYVVGWLAEVPGITMRYIFELLLNFKWEKILDVIKRMHAFKMPLDFLTECVFRQLRLTSSQCLIDQWLRLWFKSFELQRVQIKIPNIFLCNSFESNPRRKITLNQIPAHKGNKDGKLRKWRKKNESSKSNSISLSVQTIHYNHEKLFSFDDKYQRIPNWIDRHGFVQSGWFNQLAVACFDCIRIKMALNARENKIIFKCLRYKWVWTSVFNQINY